MTTFDLHEARALAQRYRRAVEYDRLAIMLMAACEEVERLREELQEAQEPCYCCRDRGCQFGCRCLTDQQRTVLDGAPASARRGEG